MLHRALLSNILHRFPPVTFAFAYGSAVIPQAGKPNGGNMLDMCFIIENKSSVDWHSNNLLRNASDYSSLARVFGPSFITSVQRSDGVGVWYNTLIPMTGIDFVSEEDKFLEYIKYGVVEERDFLADLFNWRSLYISGRCQKPVAYLSSLPPPEKHRSALETNLLCALNTSLLQLPHKFSFNDLFSCIVGLSYHGDFRMMFGEDCNKIRKLVQGSLSHYIELYGPLLKKDPSVVVLPDAEVIEQDLSPAVKLKRLLTLPSSVRNDLVLHSKQSLPKGHWKHLLANPDVEEIFAAMASWSDESRISHLLQSATRKIVFKSSVTQSVKGLITAGPFKAARYSADKMSKSVKSRLSSKK